MKSKKETKEAEVIKVKKGSPDEVKLQQKGATYQVYEKEMKEGDDNPLNPYGSGETTQQPHQVGPDTNDGFGDDPGKTPGIYQDGMDEGETTEGKKTKGKYNPWAVCTSSLGLEGRDKDSYSNSEKKKFERCVMDVKKSIKEGKNPLQVLLENSIESMVSRHITPRMTKKDLLENLSERGVVRKSLKSNTSPEVVSKTKLDNPIGKLYTLTKKEAMENLPTIVPPKVKPTTKPGTSDPFKNPKHQPKPKAETNEASPTTAPPKVKPGTKEKPGTSDPFKNPKHQPKPKAGKNMVDSNPKAPVTKIPDYLTFDQLGVQFKKK